MVENKLSLKHKNHIRSVSEINVLAALNSFDLAVKLSKDASPNQFIIDSLYIRSVIEYAKPFMKNGIKINSELYSWFLDFHINNFTLEHIDLHDDLMLLRKKVIGHNDLDSKFFLEKTYSETEITNLLTETKSEKTRNRLNKYFELDDNKSYLSKDPFHLVKTKEYLNKPSDRLINLLGDHYEQVHIFIAKSINEILITKKV